MSLLLALTGGGGVTHATSGALTGQGSAIVGTAAHIAVHGTTGALTGQLGSVSGTAARFRAFSTSGVLTGQGSTIAGSAARGTGATTHDTSGALTGSGSTIAGTAARTGVAVTHSTSGALVGSGSLINGSAFIGQILQDTHDGYWHKQWEKLHKKKPKLEEVIELVKEEPEIALEEVKEAVKREYPQIDYSQVARNAELQLVVAKQLLIALELRRIADDEEDIEILMLL